MQPTGQFHDDIIVADGGVPEHVLDDVTALDAGDEVLNDHSDAGDKPITGFLGVGQVAIARFFGGLMDLHIRQFMALKATVAIQGEALGETHHLLIANLLVMFFAFMGGAQVLDLPVLQTADQVVFQRVGFFLPL